MKSITTKIAAIFFTLFSCYHPSNATESSNLEKFIREESQVVTVHPQGNINIALPDFNDPDFSLSPITVCSLINALFPHKYDTSIAKFLCSAWARTLTRGLIAKIFQQFGVEISLHGMDIENVRPTAKFESRLIDISTVPAIERLVRFFILYELKKAYNDFILPLGIGDIHKSELEKITREYTSTHRISSFKDERVEKELSKATEKTLVIFDADKVLLRDDEDLWFQETTEDCVLQIIQLLNDRGVKTICCTNIITGAVQDNGCLPGITRNESLRYRNLASNGINFSGSFPENNDLSFAYLNPYGLPNKDPIFLNGILCTGQIVPKGLLTIEFLNAVEFIPDRVIVFDDNPYNLLGISSAFASLQIPCVTFHYTKFLTKAELASQIRMCRIS